MLLAADQTFNIGAFKVEIAKQSLRVSSADEVMVAVFDRVGKVVEPADKPEPAKVKHKIVKEPEVKSGHGKK